MRKLFPLITFISVLAFVVPALVTGKTKKRREVVEIKTCENDEWGCNTVFSCLDMAPEFPGGLDSLKSYIAGNTNYTDAAVDHDIEGVIRCQFIIGADGKVTEAGLLNNLGYGLDEEVLRVVRSMPDWIPAEDNGRKAPYRLIQTITFSLEPEEKLPVKRALAIKAPNCDTVTRQPLEDEDFIQFYKCEEQTAPFKGGTDSLMKFLATNTHYPGAAIDRGIEGTIECSFVISRDGKIREAAIIKGLGYGLDEEVIRVVMSMPDWIPEEAGGRKVSYKMVQKFTFSIPPEDKIKKQECDDAIKGTIL
ncbi:MAG: energy transducer TonB [Chitinophagaceae bacterium]